MREVAFSLENDGGSLLLFYVHSLSLLRRQLPPRGSEKHPDKFNFFYIRKAESSQDSAFLLHIELCLLYYLCSTFRTGDFNFTSPLWHSHHGFTVFTLKVSVSFSVADSVSQNFQFCFWLCRPS